MSHAEKLLKSKDIARVMEAPRGQDSSREFTPNICINGRMSTTWQRASPAP